jgi:hypothetical protein
MPESMAVPENGGAPGGSSYITAWGTQQSVDLHWTPSTSPNVTGYNIYRSIAPHSGKKRKTVAVRAGLRFRRKEERQC